MLLIPESVNSLIVGGTILQSSEDAAWAGSSDRGICGSGFMVLLVLVGVSGATIFVPRPVVGCFRESTFHPKSGYEVGSFSYNKLAWFGFSWSVSLTVLSVR